MTDTSAKRDDPKRSDLAWLSKERMIPDDSAWWPRIRQWEIRGLVRLRWSDSPLFCHVQLTDKGREYVARG